MCCQQIVIALTIIIIGLSFADTASNFYQNNTKYLHEHLEVPRYHNND